MLEDPAFRRIWESAPKAEDARRLARLIIEANNRSPEEILCEYEGWREWIDDVLPTKNVGARALMWSAAFCDGGQRKSVLRMSEDLRQRLYDDRGPAAIWRDDTSTQRLHDAEIERRIDGTVWLSPGRNGLAEALRAYLWDEYQDAELRDVLTGWLVAQLVELPFDDAERVAGSVLDIVIRFRDETLLRAMRDRLTGDKRKIAVRTFSRAAVDPRFGTHMRASLYAWARNSRSHADLVAEVCGGAFGDREPEMALVRLGWAAQNSNPDSISLASAMEYLAVRYFDVVLGSVAKWFADRYPPVAAVNAFLALASTSMGAVLLCRRADPANGQPGFVDTLISYFQRSLCESYEHALAICEAWEKLAADEVINSQTASKVLGRALGSVLGKNPMSRLHPGFPDMSSFWGRTFEIAIRGEIPDHEADVLSGQSASPTIIAMPESKSDIIEVSVPGHSG
jgi:hypothetical protein